MVMRAQGRSPHPSWEERGALSECASCPAPLFGLASSSQITFPDAGSCLGGSAFPLLAGGGECRPGQTSPIAYSFLKEEALQTCLLWPPHSLCHAHLFRDLLPPTTSQAAPSMASSHSHSALTWALGLTWAPQCSLVVPSSAPLAEASSHPHLRAFAACFLSNRRSSVNQWLR